MEFSGDPAKAKKLDQRFSSSSIVQNAWLAVQSLEVFCEVKLQWLRTLRGRGEGEQDDFGAHDGHDRGVRHAPDKPLREGDGVFAAGGEHLDRGGDEQREDLGQPRLRLGHSSGQCSEHGEQECRASARGGHREGRGGGEGSDRVDEHTGSDGVGAGTCRNAHRQAGLRDGRGKDERADEQPRERGAERGEKVFGGQRVADHERYCGGQRHEGVIDLRGHPRPLGEWEDCGDEWGVATQRRDRRPCAGGGRESGECLERAAEELFGLAGLVLCGRRSYVVRPAVLVHRARRERRMGKQGSHWFLLELKSDGTQGRTGA